MNPVIEQITLDEEIESFADEIADNIYEKFNKFHKPEIKMTKYQAAMSFCTMLKKSLYMRIINTKIPYTGITLDDVKIDDTELDNEIQE